MSGRREDRVDRRPDRNAAGDSRAQREEIVLRGVSVSPGIAVAPGFVFGDILDEVEVVRIEPSEVESEIAKLTRAIDLVKEELLRDAEHISRQLGQDKADVFLVHSMILEDRSVLEAIHRKIRDDLINVEAAVADEMKRVAGVLTSAT